MVFPFSIILFNVFQLFFSIIFFNYTVEIGDAPVTVASINLQGEFASINRVICTDPAEN